RKKGGRPALATDGLQLLSQNAQIYHCSERDRFVKTHIRVKNGATARAGMEPRWVVVVGDTVVSEQGLVAIIGRHLRYHVCGGAHGCYDPGELTLPQIPDRLPQSDKS